MSEKSLPKELFKFSQKNHTQEMEAIHTPSLNFFQDSWRRLKKNKAAMIALVILVIIIALAFLAPVIAPYDPTFQNTSMTNLPPKIPGININGLNGHVQRGENWVDAYSNLDSDVYYLFGTDQLGRDLLSRVLYGTRLSLIIAFAAVLFNLTLGVFYGLVSGWFGGRVDHVMMRILEILSGIPNLIVVVLMLLVLEPGVTSIIIALGLTEWIPMARLVRGQVLQQKNEEYVLAAKSLGQSGLNIAVRHILPNMIGLIIIQVMFSIPSAIFFEAFLSFIGIGIPAPNASLGTLINDGYQNFRIFPHLMWIPSATISILMLSFNIFADGLRDAFDPKTAE